MIEQMITSFDGSKLYCRVDGNPDGPSILFSNSLCCTVEMWDAQVSALSDAYQLIRYDYGGHGQSPNTPNKSSLDLLSRDVIAILDALKIDQVNFVGLSLGGLIGMYLGVNSPERLKSLTVSNTAPKMPTPEKWDERIRQANEDGMEPIANTTFVRWLSAGFAERHPYIYQSLVWHAREITPQGYSTLCLALRDADLRNGLAKLNVRTRVIGSTADVAPVEKIEAMASAIPSAELRIIEGAGHLANIDRSAEFTQLMKEFVGN